MRFCEIGGVIHDGAQPLAQYEIIDLLNELSEKAANTEKITKAIKQIAELVDSVTEFR